MYGGTERAVLNASERLHSSKEQLTYVSRKLPMISAKLIEADREASDGKLRWDHQKGTFLIVAAIEVNKSTRLGTETSHTGLRITMPKIQSCEDLPLVPPRLRTKPATPREQR